jgi:hypothetical protein
LNQRASRAIVFGALVFSAATMMESTQGSSFFTLTSAISLAAVAVAGLLAYVGSRALLPKNAKSIDRCAFIWLVKTLISST